MGTPGRRRRWTDEQLRDAVAASRSVRQVLQSLRLVPIGGNYATINSAIRRLHLDTCHFTRKAWRRSAKTPVTPARPLTELLQAGVEVQTSWLRQRLLGAGLMEPACAECGLRDWRGAPIVLELDHINGMRADNRLENLRLLCPNCHSQTPTYRGRNIGAPPRLVRERVRGTYAAA